MFDEQPDGDPHHECAAEIKRLEVELGHMTRRCECLTKKGTELAEQLLDAPTMAQVLELEKYYNDLESFMFATGRRGPLDEAFIARVRPVWTYIKKVARPEDGT